MQSSNPVDLPKPPASDRTATAGDSNIGQIGDIITVGDISGSYTAIGNGAQVIINQIEQALSAVDEMEKDIQAAERHLAQAIQQRITSDARLPATVGGKEQRNPYRSLLNYRIEDAPFFYGRKDAINTMLAHLDRNRLTVLQADSGSGKTSLLQAGLAARLLAAKHFPLYIRPYKAPPHKAIKRAFLPDYERLGELARFRDDSMKLQGFLRRVTSYLGPRKLFIFLDQFEEFFEYTTPECEAFVAELQQCVDDPQLDVGWVLSLREEYFSKLLRMFDSIRPYENYYFLDTFRIEEAREVITEPALKYGVKYKEGLISRIIEDVSDSSQKLAPVHVQLVCSTLFAEREMQPNPQIITPKLYYKARGTGERKAPGAKGILRSHLSRTLQQQMSGQERQLAWRVLYTLVSSQNRRAQRSRREITIELQTTGDHKAINKSELERILQLLENSRLIRGEEDDQDELHYELAHEYLLDEIEIDPQLQAIKLAQEILEQETVYYLDHGVLLPKDKYDLVNSQREHLQLDPVSRELLDKSEEQQTRELREAQERERKTRRWLRLALILAAVAIIGAVIATYYFYEAAEARDEAQQNADAAEENARIADENARKADENAIAAQENARVAEENANNLAASLLAQQATAEESSNPQLSMLLAIESYKLDPRSEAHNVLRQAVDAQIQPVTTVIQPDTRDTFDLDEFYGPPLLPPCWSTDSQYFVTVLENLISDTYQIWTIEAALGGSPLETIEHNFGQELTFHRLMPVSTTELNCYYDVVDFGTEEQPAWWTEVEYIEKSPNDSLLLLFHLGDRKTIVDIRDNSSLTIDESDHFEWSLDGSVAMSWVNLREDGYQTAVWDMVNGNNSTPLYEILSLSRPILSSDGSQIVVWTGESDIEIVEVASGTTIATLSGPAESIEWVPNQEILLIEPNRNSYELWDISVTNEPTQIKTFESDGDPEFSPTGEYFLTFNFVLSSVDLWQTQSSEEAQPIARVPSLNLNEDRWNQDGTHFMTWTEDGLVQVWDVLSAQSNQPLEETQLNFNPGLFPINSTQSRATIVREFEPRWSQSGTHVEIPHQDESTTIWDIENNQFITIYRENVTTTWHQNGNFFLSTDQNGGIELWDLDNARSPYLHAENGQWPVWGESPESNAHYCDDEFELDSLWLCLWSADQSKYLVIETLNNIEFDAFIVDAETGVEILRLPEFIDPIDGGWQTNDSIIWLNGSTNEFIYVLDASSGEVLFQYLWDGTGFALSDDLSKLLLLRESSETIELYLNGNFQNPVWSQRGNYQWASFNPDGSLFLTLDEGGNVTLWDTESQTPILVIDDVPDWSGFYEDPPPIELKPDGREIAVMKSGGQVYIYPTELYPTEPEKWIDAACAITGRNLTWAEWRASFPNDEYYHQTCADNDLSIHPSVITGILQEVSPDELADYFEAWKSADIESYPDAMETATAVEQLINAELDSYIRTVIREERISTAVSLYNYGINLPTSAPISADTLFELCLAGSVLLQVETVMFACDEAVELNQGFGPYHGARSIALLTIGQDYEEAVDDIEIYLDWFNACWNEGTSNDDCEYSELQDVLFIEESWVDALNNGENPLDRETRFLMRDFMRGIFQLTRS